MRLKLVEQALGALLFKLLVVVVADLDALQVDCSKFVRNRTGVVMGSWSCPGKRVARTIPPGIAEDSTDSCDFLLACPLM